MKMTKCHLVEIDGEWVWEEVRQARRRRVASKQTLAQHGYIFMGTQDSFFSFDRRWAIFGPDGKEICCAHGKTKWQAWQKCRDRLPESIRYLQKLSELAEVGG